MKAMMNVITMGKIFGAIKCYMYTIEWQKCGPPHAHILTWLKMNFMCTEWITSSVLNFQTQ